MSRHHGYMLATSRSGDGNRSRYSGTTGGTLPRPPDTVIIERPHAPRGSRPTDGRGSKSKTKNARTKERSGPKPPGNMARSKSHTSRHAGNPGGTGPMPSGRMVRSRSHASKYDGKPGGTGSRAARSRSRDAGRRASGTTGGTLPRPPDTLMNSDERRVAMRTKARSDRENTPPRQRRRRKSDSRPRQRARKANKDAPLGEKILIGLSKLFHERRKKRYTSEQ